MLKIQTKLLYYCTHQSLRHTISVCDIILPQTSSGIVIQKLKPSENTPLFPGFSNQRAFPHEFSSGSSTGKYNFAANPNSIGGGEGVKMICFLLSSTALYQASVIQKQLWKFWSPIKRTAIMKVFHPFLSFSLSLSCSLSVFLPLSVWPGVARCTIRRDSKLNP